MGDYVTSSSSLACPHSGTVSIVASNSNVTLGGDQIVLSTDTFTIAGCSFMVGPSPSPCTQVQWMTTALKATADSNSPLTTDSVGMCIGGIGIQGPVQIKSTQSTVSGL
jgi:hypothetical protein